jgi:hypothetical protein
MNRFSDFEVKLLVAEKLRQAECRRFAAAVRRHERPNRVGRVFGLRAPLLQGA